MVRHPLARNAAGVHFCCYGMEEDLNHEPIARPVLADRFWSYNARLTCGKLNQLGWLV